VVKVTTDLEVPDSSPTIAIVNFFHLGVCSLLRSAKKVRRYIILKVFSPEVYTTSFGGYVNPLVPAVPGPLRGNQKNKNNKKQKKQKRSQISSDNCITKSWYQNKAMCGYMRCGLTHRIYV